MFARVIVIAFMLLPSPLQAQAKKPVEEPKFDYSSLEKTSYYLYRWRLALSDQEVIAKRSGNSLKYDEMVKKFNDVVGNHIDAKVEFKARFKGAEGGSVVIDNVYLFKGHGVILEVPRIGGGILHQEGDQEIEPWMQHLKPGAVITVKGTIGFIGTDKISLNNCRISR